MCDIRFHVLRYGGGNRRYLVIHGDEDTARDVLTDYMYDHTGIGYVVTGKERNVEIDGVKVDPNRIFSRAGAERTIREFNPNMDPVQIDTVLHYLDHHRHEILRHIVPRKGGRLFALHNNRDYSVNDEIAASDQASIRQPERPREFFLCTDPRDYEILRQSPFNVVLQNKPDPDDGSLSRFAARTGFRYINLECAIGDYEAQAERVRWVDDRLS